MTIHFIGAGPGAPDLITLRAVNALRSVAAAPNSSTTRAMCSGVCFIKPKARSTEVVSTM